MEIDHKVAVAHSEAWFGWKVDLLAQEKNLPEKALQGHHLESEEKKGREGNQKGDLHVWVKRRKNLRAAVPLALWNCYLVRTVHFVGCIFTTIKQAKKKKKKRKIKKKKKKENKKTKI